MLLRSEEIGPTRSAASTARKVDMDTPSQTPGATRATRSTKAIRTLVEFGSPTTPTGIIQIPRPSPRRLPIPSSAMRLATKADR
jgi:hypothetical protein